MPITVYTGLPGHGKTAHMVEHLMREAKEGKRPIWQYGIDGLAPGLAQTLSDPKDWNAHDPHGEPTCDCHQDGNLHAHVVPDGSLIFIDEAWKWFGHLQDASRQATPRHVLALAEHRHRGIDFVWTTQMPSQLFPFARALCEGHYHVVRRFGTHFVDLFFWQELNEDVKSAAKRDMAQRTTKKLPKAVFDSYKSATVHTIKRRIPLKVLALPGMAVAAIACAYFAWQMLRPEAVAARLTGETADAALAASPSSPQGDAQGKAGAPKYETAGDYALAHTPRIATIPGSAPIFDGRSPKAEPRLFCMSTGAGERADGTHAAASCSCVTEQGTPYGLTDAECRMVARKGAPYDPYRESGDARRDVDPSAQHRAAQVAGVGAAHGDRSSSGSLIQADKPEPTATFGAGG